MYNSFSVNAIKLAFSSFHVLSLRAIFQPIENEGIWFSRGRERSILALSSSITTPEQMRITETHTDR